MRTIKISIEEWCERAESGESIPVEIKLAGNSMEPLIRRNRDTVTIVPMKREPLEGDIVLFQRYDGAYVVHRVYRIAEDRIITLGDNCEKPDSPVGRSQILGLVVGIRRGEKMITADSERQRRLGKLCMKLLPIRKTYLHLKLVIKKNCFGNRK